MVVREELEKLLQLQEIDFCILQKKKEIQSLLKQTKTLQDDISLIDEKLVEQNLLKEDFEKKILDRVNANNSDKIYADSMESKLPSISAHKEYHYTAKTIDKLRKLGRDRLKEIESFQNHLNGIQNFINEKQKEKAELVEKLNQKAFERNELLSDIEGEMAGAKTQRENLRAELTPVLFFKYESITKVYGFGLGVVKGRQCLSCDIVLPPQIYNKLQKGDEVLQCPNCQRLLYLKIQ